MRRDASSKAQSNAARGNTAASDDLPANNLLSAAKLRDWLQAHGVKDLKRFATQRCRVAQVGMPLAEGLLCSEPVPAQSQWDNGSEHYRLWHYDGHAVNLVWSGHHTHQNVELVLKLARDGASFTLREREFGGCKAMAQDGFQQIEIGSQKIVDVIDDFCFNRGRYIWRSGKYSLDPTASPCHPDSVAPHCVM